MGWITVIEPGMQTTVQDLGRAGHAAVGIPPGGAFDALSLRAGNRLVGNPDDAPGLECTLVGPTLRFEHDAAIAVTGAHPLNPDRPPWRRISLNAGDTLRIGALSGGVRAYLCVAGGVNVPRVLGSASTLLSAGFGGHHGRALRAGDRIEFNESTLTAQPDGPCVAAAVRQRLLEKGAVGTVRAVDGPHSYAFDRAVTDIFWNATFRVSSQSNRVGVRLEGPALSTLVEGDMVSEGAPLGAVQVTPSGQPIALGVDGPTTGGYPVIACVAAVDLSLLGQSGPGQMIRFERITRQQAREALVDRERQWTGGHPE